MAKAEEPQPGTASAGASGSGAGLVDVLLDSARSFLQRGELEDAGRCVVHALSAAAPDSPERTRALGLSGQIARVAGRFEDAEAAWSEVLVIERGSGETIRAAETLCNLGELARQRGHYAEALTAIRESLQLSSRETPGALRARALEEFGILQ
ncbi:MAG: tetratricopeptide repeat protein, partial [bacterium]